MKHFSLTDISLFQIEIFLAAAKELNYTSAARICNTTQPTVSKQIHTLEETLGILLFVKKSGRLQLTPAGKKLKVDFEDTLYRLNENIQQAHLLQSGLQRSLNVTLPVHIDPGQFFLHMKKSFSQLDGNENLHVNYYIEPGDIAYEKLLDYETDVVIYIDPDKKLFESNNGLKYKPLLQNSLAALMLKSNPFSSRQSVSIKDLSTQKMILPKNYEGKAYVDTVMSYFTQAQITPSVASYVTSFSECLLRLDNANEFIIIDKLSHTQDISQFVYVDIENTLSGIYIAWREIDSESEPIQKFVNFATEFFSLYQKMYA